MPRSSFARWTLLMTACLALSLLYGAQVAQARKAASEPGMSIYQLELALLDQDGRRIGLDVFRGQPVIISMFYTSCPHACPMLISSIRTLEHALDPATRAKTRVLLVSFDPDRDTPARLKSTALAMGLDLQRWRLASAKAPQVRELAAVLGIKYRRLADGSFNHASVLSVLSREGDVIARTEALAPPDETLLKALVAEAAGGGG